MGSSTRHLHRLRSIYRLLQLTFHLLAAMAGEIETVELLERRGRYLTDSSDAPLRMPVEHDRGSNP